MSIFDMSKSYNYINAEAMTRATSLYGDALPNIIVRRLKNELAYIQDNDYSSAFMLAHLITKYAHENGQFTFLRGSIGSSLIAFLLGITNVNPLPPHYYCKNCGHTDFRFADTVYSGYDLPPRKCPICQKELCTDGQNIPIEAFTHLNDDKPFKIDLCFPISFKRCLMQYLYDNFGEECITEKGDFNIDVRSQNGEHAKVNIIGFIPLDILTRLYQSTGISPKNIDITDLKIYELFLDSHSLGIDSDEPATCGVADFSADFVREILETTKPKNFGDLIRITNLSHGSNVWYKNAEDLITNNICDFRSLPASPEDTYIFLTLHRTKKSMAIIVARSIANGIFNNRFLKDVSNIEELFSDLLDIPIWYIDYFSKVRDMLPKSHSNEFTRLAVLLAWYKVYYPVEFYVASFNAYYQDIDLSNLNKGMSSSQILNTLKEFDEWDKGLFEECASRGISFEMAEKHSGHTEHFSIGDDKIIIC